MIVNCSAGVQERQQRRIDLIRQIQGRKIEFHHEAAKAAEPGLRPAIALSLNRLESLPGEIPSERVQHARDDRATPGTACGFVGLTRHSVFRGVTQLAFADVVGAIRFRVNHNGKQLIDAQQSHKFAGRMEKMLFHIIDRFRFVHEQVIRSVADGIDQRFDESTTRPSMIRDATREQRNVNSGSEHPAGTTLSPTVAAAS
jgi:hypothetical protein